MRTATWNEKLGVEVVHEDFSEMQERPKRGANRAGYRDVSREGGPPVLGEEDENAHGMEEELIDADEVAEEGAMRGQPRPRIEPEEDSSNVRKLKLRSLEGRRGG